METSQGQAPHIFITGGAGLIGTAARTYFEKKGWKTSTLDLKGKDLDGRDIDHVGDIVTFKHLKEVLENVDGVLHLAAVSRVIDAELNKTECSRVNIEGTKNLLEAASSAKCTWFIFGSSREVYGEPSLFPVKEIHGVSPINHYGEIKVKGEEMVSKHCTRNNIAYSNLRFSNVYGHPGDHKTRLVNAFLRRAIHSEPLEIHGGGQVFDFTHIDDTATAIFRAASFLHTELRSLPAIHILPGHPVGIEDLAEIVLHVTGSDSEIVYTPGRDYDVEQFYGDAERLRDLLDYECQIDIRQGLEITAKLFMLKFQRQIGDLA